MISDTTGPLKHPRANYFNIAGLGMSFEQVILQLALITKQNVFGRLALRRKPEQRRFQCHSTQHILDSAKLWLVKKYIDLTSLGTTLIDTYVPCCILNAIAEDILGCLCRRKPIRDTLPLPDRAGTASDRTCGGPRGLYEMANTISSLQSGRQPRLRYEHCSRCDFRSPICDTVEAYDSRRWG